MSDGKLTEVDLAAVVVDWLRAQHWDVYQEVQMYTGGHVADIVASNGQYTWVIECKLSLSLALLDQAVEWTLWANFVSVATPRPKRNRRPSRCVAELTRRFGLGQIAVDTQGRYVAFDRPPLVHRLPHGHKLADCLTDAHKTFAPAGNAEGHRWTPYAQTCQEALDVITSTGPMPLKQLIETMKTHHYASDATAISSLRQWLRLGKVRGLSITDGRPAMVMLREANQ